MRGGLRGTLRIGTLNSVAVIDVPVVLGAFHAAAHGADEPFVDFPPGYGNRIVVDRAFPRRESGAGWRSR